MKPLVITKSINAKPQRVFELMSDFEHAGDYISAINKVEMHTEGPVGVGTRFTETRTMFGKEATETMEVSIFEPGQSYTLLAGSHGSRYTSIMRALPEGDGTRVEFEFHAEPHSFMAKTMSMLLGPLMKGAVAKAMGQDLEDLRVAAEAGG